jgi:hypothetical protein
VHCVYSFERRTTGTLSSIEEILATAPWWCWSETAKGNNNNDLTSRP